jgi:branched-chain amino acid transport system permease protein
MSSEPRGTHASKPARSTLKTLLLSRRLWLGLLVVLCLALPQFLSSYLVYILSLLAIYSIVAIGLNILMGYAGQISVGHTGFFAIGAYTSAIAMLRFGLPFWVALPLAGLVAGAIGFLLGVPALRLSGFYLAVATLGFGIAVPLVILNSESVSGGHMGLNPPRPSAFGFQFSSDLSYFYLVFGIMLLLLAVACWLLSTKAGRAWVALRDSETAAQAVGINLAYYKTLAFAVSGFYTGIAGSLNGHLITSIHPEGYTFTQSIQFLTFIVVGGMASIPGSIMGAVFLTVVQQILSFGFPGLESRFKDLPAIMYGLCLILCIMFLPGGLAGIVEKVRDLIWRARRRRTEATAGAVLETRPVANPEM